MKKAIKLSKDRHLYNEMVVDCIMAKAVDNYLPEDGDLCKVKSPRPETSRGRQKRKNDEEINESSRKKSTKKKKNERKNIIITEIYFLGDSRRESVILGDSSDIFIL